jgi:hypothetical protein
MAEPSFTFTSASWKASGAFNEGRISLVVIITSRVSLVSLNLDGSEMAGAPVAAFDVPALLFG